MYVNSATIKLLEAIGNTFDIVSGDGVVLGSTDTYTISAGRLNITFPVMISGTAVYVAANGVKVMDLAHHAQAEAGTTVEVTLSLGGA